MSLQDVLNSIEKKFGKGAVMIYGDRPQVQIESISTGCPSLDEILGIGGLPKGRIVEIYGPESSGKTTLSLHTIAECQKAGGTVAFIDAEHALDPIYASNLGVDMSKIIMSQPDSGEQGLEILEDLVRSGEVALIVVDSVAALTPQSELDGEMSDSSVGTHARLMSKALRKITGAVSKNHCLVIFINQLRDKIGITYGSPEVTTGGKALKFYASVRIDIRRIGSIKSGEKVTGNRTKIKVVKNKLSAPHKEVEVDILYGEGISKENGLLDLAIEKGVIEKRGAWFYYNGANFSQGRENARLALKNPDLYDEISERVKEAKEEAVKAVATV